jgi:hypothetical protein
MEKVEFLGNPVRISHFCADCGTRLHPEALDRDSALRRLSEGRKLRAGVAISFFLILLLPLLLAGTVLYLVWKFL